MIESLILTLSLYFMIMMFNLVARANEDRKNNMDDDVDHDEWERGTPDRIIPESATPFNMNNAEK